MSNTPPLPNAMEIRDLFSNLIGKDVEIATDYEIIRPSETPAAVATYIDAMNNMRAIAVMDLELCSYAACAFQLIAPDVAKEDINNMVLPDSSVENVYELLNVFSSLFNKDDAPHLRIDLMYTPGEQLPADLDAKVTSFVERRDSILTIEGYGSGRLGVLVLG